MAICLCGCGKEIVVQRHHKRYGTPKYIRGHYMRGRKFSKEHNINLSNSLKGRVGVMEGKHFSEVHKRHLSEANKGQVPWHKGKRLSNEQKKNHIRPKGRNSPLWKGGRKLTRVKQYARRKKEFSFLPLNDCEVDGWVGHHMDKNHVMFIPEKLHINTPHKQSNQESMDKINEMVIDWYVNYYGLV